MLPGAPKQEKVHDAANVDATSCSTVRAAHCRLRYRFDRDDLQLTGEFETEEFDSLRPERGIARLRVGHNDRQLGRASVGAAR
ncbi:MAG: hypothetical protein IPL03_16780 [Sterolibacteriaceae bacterium]|nr:hypothetical protein [Candidatus Methylophosphatis haderslevensis]